MCALRPFMRFWDAEQYIGTHGACRALAPAGTRAPGTTALPPAADKDRPPRLQMAILACTPDLLVEAQTPVKEETPIYVARLLYFCLFPVMCLFSGFCLSLYWVYVRGLF